MFSLSVCVHDMRAQKETPYRYDAMLFLNISSKRQEPKKSGVKFRVCFLVLIP